MRNPLPLLTLLPAAALGVLLLRPDAAVPAHAGAAAKPAEYVTYASGMAQWLSAPHTLELSQGVQFGQDDATLKTNAAVALLDKDQNLVSAKAQGPVHLFDPQDDLTGQHGSVDFTKHLATLTDSIVLVVKPGKREVNADGTSVRKQFKDPATLTCQAMTYDYKFKVGRIPGPLTVTQVIQTKDDGPQTRVLTADAGLYNGKAETIQLVGDIKGTYSDGSVIEGNTRTLGKPVVISVKEGSESILVPFPTTGHFTTKPQSKNSQDDTKDDEPDLTLPTPPAHTPAPGDPAPAAPQTPPAAPLVAPKQTPAPAAAPSSNVPATGAPPAPGGAAGIP